MDFPRAQLLAPLATYEQQANQLLAAHKTGAKDAFEFLHRHLPRFLDPEVKWLAGREVTEADIASYPLALEEARLAVARWYDFRDWESLQRHVESVTTTASDINRFESAVEAIVDGNEEVLAALLASNPELVRARSSRVTHFDPERHRATLLHYIAANGVEGYRQRTPRNAVWIAKMLLEAGAEPDALADMYGGQCTTLGLLVSSCHPAQAGLQAPLVDVLVDYGASVEGRGEGRWVSPLMTALAFGYRDAAEALVRRGARVEDLAVAAGLGRIDEARRLLDEASGEVRHRALALAAQMGHAEIVRLLLDVGEDPDRYNPDGLHAHSTPMHQAALAGHLGVVRLLVDRGARVDIEDKIWRAKPLGWAIHGGRGEVAGFLSNLT